MPTAKSTEEKTHSKQMAPQELNSPAEMIRMAVTGGADLSKLEKLLELQKQWEDRQAEKIYNEDMAVVHQNIQSVVKTKKNPMTNSRYADLNQIIVQTKDVYAKEGFSVSFYEGDNAPEGHIRVMVDVQHRLGHKQTRHYDVPFDGKGIKGNVNMTAIHAKASSISYGRRYLMCMIFNIPTGDDNDGNTTEAVVVEKLDENKLKIIRDLIQSTETDEVKFLEYMEVETLEDILKTDYIKAKTALEAKKKVKPNANS